MEETLRLGRLLGELLVPRDVILLEGELGTGKTAFTQGIGCGLAVAANINSPTFTILKEYVGRMPLYHFDLYRLDRPEEFSALGFDDYFTGDGVCVVEWAERGEAAGDNERETALSPWPEAGYLRVRLYRVGKHERSLACSGHGERGRVLLTDFAHVAAMNGVE